jgi:dTDP-4-dehydrorhamnose 3,5-epimerase
MDGLIITPLKQIEDERGKVMHMLRADSEIFKSFGEIYFSSVNPGIVKGWKKHTKMIQNLACIKGNMKIVVYDDREGSQTYGKTEEIIVGESNYYLVTIYPGLWMGFASADANVAMLANCASILHDPAESIAIPCDGSEIPYKWEDSKQCLR